MEFNFLEVSCGGGGGMSISKFLINFGNCRGNEKNWKSYFCFYTLRGESSDSSLNIHASAGGGAGGSIWIEADQFTTTGNMLNKDELHQPFKKKILVLRLDQFMDS